MRAIVLIEAGIGDGHSGCPGCVIDVGSSSPDNTAGIHIGEGHAAIMVVYGDAISGGEVIPHHQVLEKEESRTVSEFNNPTAIIPIKPCPSNKEAGQGEAIRFVMDIEYNFPSLRPCVCKFCIRGEGVWVHMPDETFKLGEVGVGCRQYLPSDRAGAPTSTWMKPSVGIVLMCADVIDGCLQWLVAGLIASQIRVAVGKGE